MHGKRIYKYLRLYKTNKSCLIMTNGDCEKIKNAINEIHDEFNRNANVLIINRKDFETEVLWKPSQEKFLFHFELQEQSQNSVSLTITYKQLQKYKTIISVNEYNNRLSAESELAFYEKYLKVISKN